MYLAVRCTGPVLTAVSTRRRRSHVWEVEWSDAFRNVDAVSSKRNPLESGHRLDFAVLVVLSVWISVNLPVLLIKTEILTLGC
jgi:hypothetical protein